MRNRVAICGALFTLLWLIYAFLPTYLFDLSEPAEMSWVFFGITISIMLAAGGLISMAVFEFEFVIGVAHAGLYLIATLLLAVASGMTIAGIEPAEMVR